MGNDDLVVLKTSRRSEPNLNHYTTVVEWSLENLGICNADFMLGIDDRMMAMPHSQG